MKLGRNDICHCGSGKKYKKCCLEKDEEQQRMQRAAQAVQAAAQEEEEQGPQFDDAQLARLKEFSEAGFEEQFTIFNHTLTDKELVNRDVAFVMLNHLNDQTRLQNQRDRFSQFLHQFRAEQSELFESYAFYYYEWLIENALYQEQFEEAERLSKEFVAREQVEPGEINDIQMQLSYFNRAATVLELARAAWSKIKNSQTIEPNAKLEYAVSATIYETLDFVEHEPDPVKNIDKLKEIMKDYLVIENDKLERNVLYLANQANRSWQLRDFAFNINDHLRSEKETARIENFYYLTFEFLHALRYQANLPMTRGEIGRAQLCSYLLARNNGELSDEGHHHQHDKPKAKKRTHFENALCPDGGTVDTFIHNIAEIMGGYSYETVGFYEILAAWVDFLRSRQLVEPAQHEKAMSELTGLKEHFLEHLDSETAHPALIDSVKNWPTIRIG